MVRQCRTACSRGPDRESRYATHRIFPTAKIRDELSADTRLFALTGYGQPTDRERAKQAGFAAHFVKPVDVKQLIESIANP